MIIWDDDHYYMGGVLAELCRYAGHEVVLVTTAAMVSAWTVNTLEAMPIAKRMARIGVEVVPYTSVTGYDGEAVELTSVLTGEKRIAARRFTGDDHRPPSGRRPLPGA